MGPRADHTYSSPNGHYLLFDGSKPYSANPLVFTSDPVTTVYNSSTPACLSFWYYVDSESQFNLTYGYYSAGGTLGLLALGKKTGSQVSRYWKSAQGTIYIIPGSQLSIQLHPSTPFIGSLAIDDIKLAMGACKYDQGQECDFSSGLCGFQVKFS